MLGGLAAAGLARARADDDDVLSAARPRGAEGRLGLDGQLAVGQLDEELRVRALALLRERVHGHAVKRGPVLDVARRAVEAGRVRVAHDALARDDPTRVAPSLVRVHLSDAQHNAVRELVPDLAHGYLAAGRAVAAIGVVRELRASGADHAVTESIEVELRERLGDHYARFEAHVAHADG